jgi:hypothetical protein
MMVTVKLGEQQAAWLDAHLTVYAKLGPNYDDRQVAKAIGRRVEKARRKAGPSE